MSNDIINVVIKNFILNLLMYMLTLKFIYVQRNWKINALGVAESIFTTSIYVILKPYIDILFNVCISYFIQVVFLNTLIKNKNVSIISANLLSNALVYLLFGISVPIEFIIKYVLKIYNDTINIILILLIETLIICIILKMKRFKDGIVFLKNNINNDYIDSILINISCILILIYCLFNNDYGNYISKILIAFSLVRNNVNCYASKNSYFILQAKVITSNY